MVHKLLEKNWDYYAPRTDITYGSSLGPAIHGLVAASLGDTGEAYENFRLAALVDLENTRGNAAEGIHAASCGSIWQAVIFGVAGIQFTKNGPVAKPNLPPLGNVCSLNFSGAVIGIPLTSNRKLRV